MAALRDLVDVDQLAFLAVRTFFDIDAGDVQHQLPGILDRWFNGLGMAIQQLADQCNVVTLAAVEQKAELADFYQPLGQHMQQIAPDELIGGHGHDARAVIGE